MTTHTFRLPCWLWSIAFAALLLSPTAGSGVEVHGVVQEPGGDPLAGVLISASSLARDAYFSSATDVNGNYTFELPTGVWVFEFMPSASGPAYRPGQPVTVPICGPQEIIFTLHPYEFPRKILGRVVGGPLGAGQPTRVSASRMDGFHRLTVTANTDSDGEFELAVFAGEWTLSVTPNSSSELGPSLPIDVPLSNDVVIVVESRTATRTVTGVVRDADNYGVPFTFVRATAQLSNKHYEFSAFTDYLGTFTALLFDAEWDFEVTWSYPGSFEQHLLKFDVSSLATNVVVQLPPESAPVPVPETTLAEWGGRVVDELGNAISNVVLSTSLGGSTNTDSNGRFTITLPAGYQTLAVAGPENFVAPQIQISPRTDVTESNVSLVCHHATSLAQVHLHMTNGEPPIGARITASTFSNGLIYQVSIVADCQGTGALPLFPGLWRFSVAQAWTGSNSFAVPVSKWVVLSPGSNDVSLFVPKLDRTISLHVNLIDEVGHPLNETISLFSSDGLGDEVRGTSNEDGFDAELSSGQWQIFLSPQSLIGCGIRMNLLPSTTVTNVTLVVRRGNRRLSVAFPDALPGEFISVNARAMVGGTNYFSGVYLAAEESEISLSLFDAEWWIGVLRTDPLGNWRYVSTNILINGGDRVIEWFEPPSEEEGVIDGRVVNGHNFAIPFAVVRSDSQTASASDGSFVLPATPYSIVIEHPWLPLTATVTAPTNGNTNVLIVLPEEVVPVNCEVLDSSSNRVPAAFVAVGEIGGTTLVCYSTFAEDLRSLLLVPRGDWRIYPSANALNGQGFQAVPPTAVALTAATNLSFAAMPFVGDPRVARVSIRGSGSLMIEARSQVDAESALEESNDLVTWHRVATSFGVGGVAKFTVPPPSGTPQQRFFRAVWIGP